MLAKQVSQASVILKHGGVIAYSTETVLGLGCDPFNSEAVNRILWLKNRAVESGLIMLVDSIKSLQEHTTPLSANQVDSIVSADNTTWLVPANEQVSSWVRGKHEKLAVRITDHPIASRLSSATQGIISTSANISAYKTLKNRQEIWDWFGPHVDYVLIDCAGSGTPSQICDLLSGKILRSNKQK